MLANSLYKVRLKISDPLIRTIKLLPAIALLLSSPTVLALSTNDLDSIYTDSVWYDDSVSLNTSPCSPDGGSPGIPSNQSPTDSIKSFVDAYGQMAYNDSVKTGVPWEVTLAQAIIESGYGQSQLSAKYNNFFGIKAGSDWQGQTVEMPTTECNSSGCYDTTGTFRAYSSPQESFTDHSNFLRTNSRYSKAFQFSNDSFKFLREVANAGYATAPDYYSVVGGIMQQIIDYNAQAKLFIPSSQIKFETPPPGTSSDNTVNSCEETTPAGQAIEGELGLSSDTIDCAPGTNNLGVVKTNYVGEYKTESGPLIIRLCQVPSIPGEGNNASGTEIGGGVVVNSRVSGAWHALGLAAKDAGIALSASSSFRLADSCGGTGDGSYCARPGHSPHQMGVAIDFGNNTYVKSENTTSCSGRATDFNSSAWVWLYKNAEKFGFKQYSAESWHFDPLPSANRCGFGDL